MAEDRQGQPVAGPDGAGPTGRVTAGSVMAAHRGVGPGFDWCRIGLSLGVLLFHAAIAAEPHALDLLGWPHPLFAAILPMFFGLSGFLVTGSAIRLRNVWSFLTFRILRIIPALMVEVTLSAIVLGSLLTTLPLARYYRDPGFYTYFGNIVGWIHLRLPGVFLDNPSAGIVNGNLWTLHPEFICYGIMAALIVGRLIYSRRLVTLTWAVLTVAGIAANLRYGLFELQYHYGGTILTYAFVTGVVAFHWRDHIVLDWRLFVAALVASYGLIMVPHTAFVVPIVLMYVIIWLGMQTYPRIELLQRGDYSYGIYLYGCPLQQTLVLLVPAVRHWYLLFPLSAVVVTVFAALSWHIVEKPALRLKTLILRKPAPALQPAGAAGLDAARALEAARV